MQWSYMLFSFISNTMASQKVQSSEPLSWKKITQVSMHFYIFSAKIDFYDIDQNCLTKRRYI